ncbi:thioredoxin-like domain-containing protein [Agaribacter flavus]|uniref:Thioredoxin-like domain-containing protein n=1 Tax=Agaribacter flavus TaxID=1902781 RepID=A0ABV7FJM0_9ALTE
MEAINKDKKKWPRWAQWLRDIVLFVIIISAITAWQSRHMLDDDGSVKLENKLLPSIEGEFTPLLADDKPTLIYFFAPWCKICSLSIGNLAYLDTNKVNVVAVALDYNTNAEVQAFVDEHEVTSTVMLGNNILKNEFQIQGYPSYYLVDKNQQVVSRAFGYSTAVGLKLRETFGAL